LIATALKPSLDTVEQERAAGAILLLTLLLLQHGQRPLQLPLLPWPEAVASYNFY